MEAGDFGGSFLKCVTQRLHDEPKLQVVMVMNSLGLVGVPDVGAPMRSYRLMLIRWVIISIDKPRYVVIFTTRSQNSCTEPAMVGWI
jgi:hypothetical protein